MSSPSLVCGGDHERKVDVLPLHLVITAHVAPQTRFIGEGAGPWHRAYNEAVVGCLPLDAIADLLRL